MNYNDVMKLLEDPVGPRFPPPDLQRAERARQLLDSTEWGMFIREIETRIKDAKESYDRLKDQMAKGFHTPDQFHWIQLRAKELEGQVRALEGVLRYLPSLASPGTSPAGA